MLFIFAKFTEYGLSLSLIISFKTRSKYGILTFQSQMAKFVIVTENHMLDWHLCQICYPLEIQLLLLVCLLHVHK